MRSEVAETEVPRTLFQQGVICLHLSRLAKRRLRHRELCFTFFCCEHSSNGIL